PRPLHSFPPRRSSDLPVAIEPLVLVDAALHLCRVAAVAARRARAGAQGGPGAGLRGGDRERQGRGGEERAEGGRGSFASWFRQGDRKSTRLNSSHVKN